MLVAENSSEASSMAECHMSWPRPFASGDVCKWLQRFEICFKADGWEDEVKALKLLMLLEKEAFTIRFELTQEEKATTCTRLPRSSYARK